MILFIFTFAARSIDFNSDDVIYISSDLIISCLDGNISDYSVECADPTPFLVKENIMKSEFLEEKINTMKKSKSYKKIMNLQSKIKIFLFKYDEYPMMLLHNSAVFMSTFFEFFDMVMKFYKTLKSNQKDVSICSISLYNELVRTYGVQDRIKGITKANVLNMLRNTLKVVSYFKHEIYTMNLSFRSRTSESVLLGFYYISNILKFQIDNNLTLNFGDTLLNQRDKYNQLQVYILNEGYKIYNMYDLVEMYVKMFLFVEVKSRICFIKKWNELN